MAYSSNNDKRFAQAVRSSGLVEDEELSRALQFQERAKERGRDLPLDRILLKFNLLSRDEILGLWRALRYYMWRKEDKFYVKIAIQSKLLSEKQGQSLLREQKKAYKHENELGRVNELARQRGYVSGAQDRAIVEGMLKVRPVSLRPVDEDSVAEGRVSVGAAKRGEEDAWRETARREELRSLRKEHAGGSASQRLKLDLFAISNSEDLGGVSDEDLDALWAEADRDDVELDSQAVEVARSPLDMLDSDDSDSDF